MNILQHHWFIHSAAAAAAAAALGKRLTNGGVDCAPLLPSLLMLTASGLKTLKRVRPSVGRWASRTMAGPSVVVVVVVVVVVLAIASGAFVLFDSL